MKTPLTRPEIAARLPSVPAWCLRGNAIERTFDRGDFEGAIAFVSKVAAAARAADHHPEIRIAWNMVTLTLSSHDAGGLTERDFRLAAVCDAL